VTPWPDADVLAAVRSHFAGARMLDGYVPLGVSIEGRTLLVTFRRTSISVPRDDTAYGLQFSLRTLPRGTNTGEECQDVEEWAQEVRWDLDEEIGTGLVEEAARRVRDDGVVVLRWRHGAWER
jgi:hypothetical protein